MRHLTRRGCALALLLGGAVLVAGCSGPSGKLGRQVDPKYGVAASPRVVEPGQPVPKGGGTYRVGKPYMVAGRMYVPEEDRRHRSEGIASWYGEDFHGRLTANGEVYDMHAISAAHPTLPMPSYVRVTNLANRRSLIVRVNDRGPFHANRVIDLSGKAAELLAFRGNGLARVRVEYVGPAQLEGSDDRLLMATLREGTPAALPSTVRVASARPFLPDLGSRAPWRGPAPVPGERPFELGEAGPVLQTGAERRAAGPSFEMTAARAQTPAMPGGAAAFAPIRPEDAKAVTTGRGLY